MKKAETGVGATQRGTPDEDRWQAAVQEFAHIMEEAFDVEKSLKLEPAEIEGWLAEVWERAKARLHAGLDEVHQGKKAGQDGAV
ncbi:MAG TPA: hypothetical protein VMW83_15745 [Spirochaetia bacterium]|nr:hypothetical protein [Spirochaetia bacterium]